MIVHSYHVHFFDMHADEHLSSDTSRRVETSLESIDKYNYRCKMQ